MRVLRAVLSIVIFLSCAGAAWAQLSEAEKAAVRLGHDFAAKPNITYKIANNYEAKLDVYFPREAKSPVPVVMRIHGGGWVAGNKEEAVPSIVPYMQMGFAVVNVEYRLAKVSLAPAAVEDCLCALHWVGRHAKEYNFDLNKIVVTGGSAGGHLALTTGMIPASAGLDNECSFDDDPAWNGAFPYPRPKVAAVINWFGITDVADMLQGPNMRGYAVAWLGSLPNREEVAKRVSPLTYVRPGLPPIFTIHGDADKIVPYSHAVRLHEALTKAGVQNKLYTVPGGGHGGFTVEQNLQAFEAVRAFLESIGIITAVK
jgi:acetyl esterase/lipase